MNRRTLIKASGITAAGALGYGAYRNYAVNPGTPGPITAVDFEERESDRSSDPIIGGEPDIRTNKNEGRIKVVNSIHVGGSHHRANLKEVLYDEAADEVTVAISSYLPWWNIPKHYADLSDDSRVAVYQVTTLIDQLPETITVVEQPNGRPQRTTSKES